MTREEWLTKAGQLIYEHIISPVAVMPPGKAFAVSCGWPSKRATARSNRRVGECWSNTTCSDGNTFHIFVSPVLSELVDGRGDGVLPTLVHELIHAVVYEAGHKGEFKRIGKAIGLEGKMTCSVAGEALAQRLRELTAPLGPYPHAAITPATRGRTQSCRFVKVMAVKCTQCQYVARTTRKWLDEVGQLRCPHGSRMEEVK